MTEQKGLETQTVPELLCLLLFISSKNKKKQGTVVFMQSS